MNHSNNYRKFKNIQGENKEKWSKIRKNGQK